MMPARLALHGSTFGIAATLLAACGDPFMAGAGGAGGGTTASTSSGVGPGEGCSDGTREAFVNTAKYPDVAGCSGGFAVPGLALGLDLTPSCSRAAGNDSDNPAGMGCSASDLCAEGWHVCNGAKELGERISLCDPSAAGFFATRQALSNNECRTQPAANDIVGCGTLGVGVGSTCDPLTRALRFSDCDKLSTWRCGTDGDQAHEAEVVFKTGPEDGGVLCCRDPEP